jgi:prevent-host-death family protein
MSSTSITEARAALPSIVDRVINGEEITLTRHGVPVAVVVRPDRLRSPQASGLLERVAQLRATLDEAGSQPLDIGVGITAERADELVAHVDWSRGERWAD